MKRRLLWPVLAAGFALVGGVALLVAANAVLDLSWDPQAAVVQAVVAVWLVSFPLFGVLVGGRRCESAVAAELRAEVERRDGRIADLEDHLIYHYDCQHLGRFADDSDLRPDLGVRPDWASINRKPEADTASSERDTSPSPAFPNP